LIAGAALVGFALSRMIKAGVTGSSDGVNTASSDARGDTSNPASGGMTGESRSSSEIRSAT
jgi:hypothetical protein